MILNLAQHIATPSQIKAGVVEPENKKEIQDVLLFKNPPSFQEIREKALKLVEIAKQSGCRTAMIDGPPYLIGILEAELKEADIQPLHSFTERKSFDKHVDGKVERVQTFEHIAWVEV